jgi:hypothetical protein
MLISRVLAWAWSPGFVLIDDEDVAGKLHRRVVLREEDEDVCLLNVNTGSVLGSIGLVCGLLGGLHRGLRSKVIW